MKKSNLLEILAASEDERLINFVHSFIKGYSDNKENKSNSEVKVLSNDEIFEEVSKTKLQEAAYTLDGELFEIERDINKILFLLQELQEQYFYKFDVRKDEDQKEIFYGYERNATYTEIIFDNAIHIEKVLNGIKKNSENE